MNIFNSSQPSPLTGLVLLIKDLEFSNNRVTINPIKPHMNSFMGIHMKLVNTLSSQVMLISNGAYYLKKTRLNEPNKLIPSFTCPPSCVSTSKRKRSVHYAGQSSHGLGTKIMNEIKQKNGNSPKPQEALTLLHKDSYLPLHALF